MRKSLIILVLILGIGANANPFFGQSGLQKSLVCNDTTNNKGSKHVVTTPQMVTYVGSHGGGGGGGDTVTQIETRHHAAITYKSKGDSLRTTPTAGVTQFQKNADTTKHYNWDVLQLALKQNVLTSNSTLPNGVIATTQSAGDTTTKIATDAFVSNFDSMYYGRQYLYNYDAAVAKDSCIVNLIGDSWTMGVTTYSAYLKKYCDANYGSMGDGYLTFYGDPSYYPNGSMGSTLITKTGTWTNVQTYGINQTNVTSTDIATPAKIVVSALTSKVLLHYLKIAGGGSFTWQIGANGSPTTISTDSAGTGMSFLGIASLPVTAYDTLVFKVTVAGTAGVNICGIDITNGTAGFKINNLGVTGTTASFWTGLTYPVFKKCFENLGGHLSIIMLGVNDIVGGVYATNFGTRMDTLIHRIKTIKPKSDIIIMTPADIGNGYDISVYIPLLKSLARKYHCGFINNYALFGSYANGNARNLYSNFEHLNVTGSSILFHNLKTFLTKNRIPDINITSDPVKLNFYISKSLDAYYSSVGTNNYSISNVNPKILGNYNSAFGFGSFNPSGNYNSKFGALALQTITSGSNNGALGNSSLLGLTTGNDNTVSGYYSLPLITTNSNNTASGSQIGKYLTNAANNVLIGATIMPTASTTAASDNVMVGFSTAYYGASFYYNTYLGRNAGYGKTTYNTISIHNQIKIGYYAGSTDSLWYRIYIEPSASSRPLFGGDANPTIRKAGINKIISEIGTTFDVGGSMQVSSNVSNSLGGYARFYVDTICTALSGASGSIPVNIPTGAKLLGTQLRVDVAITSGDGATSWAAAYATGSTQAITTGQVFTKNTKVNTMFNDNAATSITTNTTTITITPNSGTFSAGVVRAICYYEYFTTMGNKP